MALAPSAACMALDPGAACGVVAWLSPCRLIGVAVSSHCSRPRCGLRRTMDILGQRIALTTLNDELQPVLMEVDAAAEVLEKMDEDMLHSEQKDAKKHSEERSQFLAAYTGRRRSVCPAPLPSDAAKGKGRGRGRGGSRGRATDAPRYPSSIEHSTAARFLPDGASCWRGLTRQEWCGHFPPNLRIHQKWCVAGEAAALKGVIRRLWMQFAEHHGLEYPACCPHAQMLMSEGDDLST